MSRPKYLRDRREEWAHRNVFVTGATGLLGSWLTRDLVELGANVVVLVRDWVPRSELVRTGLLDRVVVVRGEVQDQTLLERVLNEYEVETVFHLAAQTIVEIANTNPVSTFESNIKGTWSLLEAVRRVPRVGETVIASSDKAYGTHEELPYEESAPLRGTAPYDVSKSCADLIAGAYYETYGLNLGITRCGNLYGGGDLNFNRIVPGTVRSVILDEPIVIRSDGSFIRDYFYVRDGSHAYLTLGEELRDGGHVGEAFNFSNEIQVTVLELVELILELMEAGGHPVEILDEVESEIRHQYLSAEKARRELEWTPVYDLRTGLRETIDWYRDHFATLEGEG